MNFDVEAKSIAKKIEDSLSGAGIFFRIFFRGKSESSLAAKIENNPGKYGDGKKIQDLIGIRVCLYFSDDVELAKQLICGVFEYDKDSSTIDKPEKTEFGPTRFNLIYRMPPEMINSIGDGEYLAKYVDYTFEVQLRTICLKVGMK